MSGLAVPGFSLFSCYNRSWLLLYGTWESPLGLGDLFSAQESLVCADPACESGE